ncbi:MAG: hypothetical protein JWM05_505 [Acidimicrobiales bacterium]|nr:hypothetical protein [Acidimicrobiales bacterium]
MPSWTPRWADVRFDHGAADRAASACERAARLVSDAAAERSQLVRRALSSAFGPRIEALGQHDAGLRRTDRALEEHLRSLALRLRAASAAAASDQVGRVAERTRWKAESADEARLLEALNHPPPPA